MAMEPPLHGGKMETDDTIIRDAESARQYDEQAQMTNWLGPQVVFGLAYEFVRPGETLLDVGIGSGLSSVLFHQAGLRVRGIDGSQEILEVCAAKNFTEELKLHNLRQVPLPYADHAVDHIVAIAVLNSFKDLAPLFHEFGRLMKEQGILVFTVEEQKPGQSSEYAINRVEVSELPTAEAAVMLYRHPAAYIEELLAQNGFRLLRSLEFVAFRYPAENRDILFRGYVARKIAIAG
jgi:predicted TPR repeat methyltransferase